VKNGDFVPLSLRPQVKFINPHTHVSNVLEQFEYSTFDERRERERERERKRDRERERERKRGEEGREGLEGKMRERERERHVREGEREGYEGKMRVVREREREKALSKSKEEGRKSLIFNLEKRRERERKTYIERFNMREFMPKVLSDHLIFQDFVPSERISKRDLSSVKVSAQTSLLELP
jgi:hypothetical protein